MEVSEQVILEFETACQLGEGPIWEDDLQRLLWVDILGCCVHVWYPETKVYSKYLFSLKISAIARKTPNHYLAASDEGFVELDLDRLSVSKLVNPESGLPDNRFNDGKMDNYGRFWAGTMDDKHGSLAAGKLYMLHPDNRVEIKIDKVTCSNGLVWNYKANIFYFIDTGSRQVMAYDYEQRSGEISNPRVVVAITELEGLPDGMTIDRNGMLWIAIWGGWKVSCWNPFTGEKIRDIYVPVSQVTSCVFGGQNNQDLFITSARVGLSSKALKLEPLAGSIFKVINPLGLT